MATLLSWIWKTNYLLNFNQSPSFFNIDVSLFAFASDQGVSSFEMSTESVVSVDDGYLACIPTDLSVLGVPVPKWLRNEEVVTFDLSSEGWRRNVEDGITSVEVMKISWDLVACDLPRWVLSIGIEWMFEVSPSFIESFDWFIVGLLTHGDD